MANDMTGGCQCGRVRYTAKISSTDAYLCHCRMCQRASGGFAAAFVNLPRADLTWHSEPDWYASSAIAERPFCSTCGTPLGFRYPDSDKIDLMLGSFDDPAGFVPTSHFGAETMHRAWLDTTGLPEQRCDSYQPLVSRWEQAQGKLP